MPIEPQTQSLIRLALREDLGKRGDITTRFFLPKDKKLSARLIFKESGVLCGTAVFDEVLRRVCPSARVSWKYRDGVLVPKGSLVARIRGPRDILTAERTALNFLQKLSGMATLTRAFVDKTKGSRTSIYDTRKTLPGWRALSKYAVRTGGGRNHRQGLYDMAMLKDTHLTGLQGDRVFAAMVALTRLKVRYPGTPLCMEAGSTRELSLAISFGADIILLDNMTPTRLSTAIRRIRREAPPGTQIEISGGVRLETVGRLARLGADRISVGVLTHSAPALDISLRLEEA